MNFKALKGLRIAISLLFFLVIGFLFIDFSNTFSSDWTNGILFTQFAPSLLKFTKLLSLAAAGFIFILLLTLLFGRVYCSTFCPLGTLQDLIHYLRKRFGKKKRMKFMRPMNWLRYGVLAVTAVLLLAGSAFMLNLLDPYSLFGKISSNLARPVYYSANNLAAKTLEQKGIYTLYPVDFLHTGLLSIIFSIAVLGLLIWLAVKWGRLWCNTACPVGTFLGLVSRISIFRIRLNKTLCTHCGICSAVCKASCIDSKNSHVDFSRCVGCLNCLTVCPENGVLFSASVSGEHELKEQAGRRDFIARGLLLPLGLMAAPNLLSDTDKKKGVIPVNRENPTSPPGSGSIGRFIDSCTGCNLCVSACPTKVLQPSFLQYGMAGMMMPHMDYSVNFCNYDCTVCGEICPTGAILPLTPEDKRVTQIGRAKFIKENCIVYTDENDCGACSEHCPTKAVNMVHYKGNLTIPEVNEDICVGCGACEYACPTDPLSIYVEGNPIHQKADKPKEEAPAIEVDPEDDFPF